MVGVVSGALVVALLMVLPRLGPRRLPFWFSYCPWATIGVVCLDVLVTGVIGCGAALVSDKGGWSPTAMPEIDAIFPALLANLSARIRRPGGSQPADTLAFSLLAGWHNWLDGHVESAVQDWAWDETRVPTDLLVPLCARYEVEPASIGSGIVKAHSVVELAAALSSGIDADELAAKTSLRNALAHEMIDRHHRRPR